MEVDLPDKVPDDDDHQRRGWSRARKRTAWRRIHHVDEGTDEEKNALNAGTSVQRANIREVKENGSCATQGGGKKAASRRASPPRQEGLSSGTGISGDEESDEQEPYVSFTALPCT